MLLVLGKRKKLTRISCFKQVTHVSETWEIGTSLRGNAEEFAQLCRYNAVH